MRNTFQSTHLTVVILTNTREKSLFSSTLGCQRRSSDVHAEVKVLIIDRTVLLEIPVHCGGYSAVTWQWMKPRSVQTANKLEQRPPPSHGVAVSAQLSLCWNVWNTTHTKCLLVSLSVHTLPSMKTSLDNEMMHLVHCCTVTPFANVLHFVMWDNCEYLVFSWLPCLRCGGGVVCLFFFHLTVFWVQRCTKNHTVQLLVFPDKITLKHVDLLSHFSFCFLWYPQLSFNCNFCFLLPNITSRVKVQLGRTFWRLWILQFWSYCKSVTWN